MAELTKIEHLADFPKRLLQLCTVSSRIESFLEDLNVEPVKALPVKFDLGGARRTGVFHASSVGTFSGKSLCEKYKMGCARLLYYDFTGAPGERALDTRLRRIFDTGSAIHGQLQAYLEKIAELSDGEFTFIPEVDVNPDDNEVADQMDMSGHTDGDSIAIAKDDKVRFLTEIKSINAAGYEKTSGPHPEHKVQATIYQRCLDVPVMVFLYYSKNDSNMAEFVHTYDERIWDAIVRKLDFVRECAMDEQPPDREDGWHCSNCKYKKICKPPRRGRGARKATTVSAFRSKGK